MSKVFCVVRATKEKSLKDCLASLDKLGFDYAVIKNDDSLESKAKRTIQIGGEVVDKYDWIMAVDADVMITKSKEWIENYCEKMNETSWFCFTAWLDCTKRGLITGLHFYRTDKCKDAYDIIKKKDFSWHKGREEYKICRLLKIDYNFFYSGGTPEESFGTHLFYINNKI